MTNAPLRLLLACLLLWCGVAAADPQSRSFSRWTVVDGEWEMTYTLAAREATRLPGYRNNPDLASLLGQQLASTVSLRSANGPCTLLERRNERAREGFLRIAMRWRCPESGDIELALATLFNEAPSHIHFARIERDGQPPLERLFTRRQQQHTLGIDAGHIEPAADAAPDTRQTILTYIMFGFEHILIGLDHIAFLLTLMLLARRARDLVLIVTGFTIGHSVTLSLTVLGLATPRLMVVEALIGFTIAIVAVENVTVHLRSRRAPALLLGGGLLLLAVMAALGSGDGPPVLTLLGLALFSACYLLLSDSEATARSLRPGITLLFGLIHGFGFASVLLEVGLPEQALVPALFGFNLGVEFGQLAIVGVIAVLAAGLRRALHRALQGELMGWLNAALCSLGSFWFIQRLYF